MRRQGLDLDIREVDADTDARAAAERHQRVGRTPVLLARRRKSVQVEDLRVGKDMWQMMARRQRQAHSGASRYLIACELEVFDHTARHIDHWRVEPASLFD